ncbi:MAG: type II toxin -antitoxin system TacA 1-like antitoxin [Planctomycetota bacterium]|jgi:uncharacterized protein (DUF1778 family)
MAKRRKYPPRGVENRDVTRSCRLTPTEAAQLEEAAALDGKRPTAYMREAVIAAVRKTMRRHRA